MNPPLHPQISDDFWKSVEPLVPKSSHRVGDGRKPIDRRKVLDAILFVLKTRNPWRSMPKSLGSGATAHRYFENWKKAGFFDALQNSPLATHPELANFPWPQFSALPCNPKGGRAVRTGVVASKQTSSCLTSSAVRNLRHAATVTVTEHGIPSIFSSRMQNRILNLHAATDVSSFWSATQSILRDTVPHNAIIAYLDYLDHPKTWKAAKIMASANAQMPSEWFEKRWKVDITPAYVQSHRGIPCFRLSDIIQDTRELERTEFFNYFFKPFGWRYTACVQIWNNHRINSAIALRRTKEQGDFSPAELEFLEGLQPHIQTVLQRLLPSQKQETKLRWLTELAQGIPTAVMFLDWNLEPLIVNKEALAQCAIWNLGAEAARAYNPREVFRVPEEFLSACAELKAEWLRQHGGLDAVKAPSPSVKILNLRDPSRMASIALAAPNRETLLKPGFRIQFLHNAAPRDTGDDYRQHALQWRLTSAERELVQLASLGYSNTEIACRLSKSVNTVKHQFTSIYSKLGVNSPRKGFLRRIFVNEMPPERVVQAGETRLFATR